MDESDNLAAQVAALSRRVAALEAQLQALRGGRLAAPAPRSIPGRSEVQTARETTLESRIGSQVFNRVGIVAVLIGAAWFLKLAIDRGYLGPLARVLVGVVAGLALIAGSERFRSRGYAAFSYSLKAVGGGVLFLSIWAAYALFDLIGLAAAAAAMVMVTAGLGALAWMQDSELLLAYALVGGFLSPLLLSNGRNHEASLFGYLLVMDIASLVLVARKPWPRIALGLLAGTGGYALGWYLRWYSREQFGETLLFAIGTFALFAAMPYLVRAQKDEDDAEIMAIWLPLLTAGSAFVAALLLFHDRGRAAAQLALALLYYALAAVPGRSRLATLHGVAANGFLLAAGSFAIHEYWLGTTGEFAAQVSYSGWFMLLGAVLLALGFARARPPLRWQGLVLLSFAAGKVFLVDMSRLAQGYRVLSFLGLGLLLLGISFLYQRDLLGLRVRDR